MFHKVIQWRQGEKKQFSAVISGDFSPREENSDDVAQRADEITGDVKEYFYDSDLRIVQWETCVTLNAPPIKKSGPNLRCHPECISFVKALKTDVVLLANNHTGDYGKEGIEDTLAVFRKNQISTVGLEMNSVKAEAPLSLERNGLQIALLNAAEHEFGIAEKGLPGINGLNPFRLAKQIHEAKAEGKIVIVTLHGGHELYAFPSPRMKELFRFLADEGADAVFNCHTHCPLGYEIYNGVPIVYCPGNFYFPPRPDAIPCWFIGYLPKFYFDEHGAFQLEILPYFNTKKKIRCMNEEESRSFFDYMKTICDPISDDEKLQQLFDAWSIHFGLPFLEFSLYNCEKKDDWNSQTAYDKFYHFRNSLTCEAHHDLMKNTALLIQYQKLEEPVPFLPEIKAMQNPPWVKKDELTAE